MDLDGSSESLIYVQMLITIILKIERLIIIVKKMRSKTLFGSKHELVNCHYFGGDYAGTEGTKELWQEVFDFITESYDEEVLEKIYINGDGADWIRTGAGMHAKARFVLDRFHMHKYIISATSHLKDSAQDARSEIYRAINGKAEMGGRRSI